MTHKWIYSGKMIIMATLAQVQSTKTSNPIQDLLNPDHPSLFIQVGDGKYVLQDFSPTGPDVLGMPSLNPDAARDSLIIPGKFDRGYVLITQVSSQNRHIKKPSNYFCSCTVFQQNTNFIDEVIMS